MLVFCARLPQKGQTMRICQACARLKKRGLGDRRLMFQSAIGVLPQSYRIRQYVWYGELPSHAMLVALWYAIQIGMRFKLFVCLFV